MEQLQFIGKSMAKGESDVQITHSWVKGGYETTYITFRNGVSQKIAPHTECVTYAISGTRVYFKEASPMVGYKMSQNRKKGSGDVDESRRYVSPAGDRHQQLHKWSEKYQGEFDLVYDSRFGLWCIDANGLTFNGKAGPVTI